MKRNLTCKAPAPPSVPKNRPCRPAASRPGQPTPGGAPPLAAVEQFERLLTEDLHDSVCQSLAGTSFLVNVLQRQAGAGQAVKGADLQKVAAFLERAMDDLRAMISPDSLAATGLGVALEKFARETSLNVACRLTVHADSGADEPRTALVLYRLARWAVRHAVKSSDTVSVALRRSGGAVTLEIRDGGAATFRQMPPDVLAFLHHYAGTAAIAITLDDHGSTWRAHASASS
jgi:hypothetical protein